MVDYNIPATGDLTAIGSRARRLRQQLGISVGQLTAEAEVTERDVEALESGGDVSLAAMLAIHQVLSGEGAGDNLFTRPRFRSIDEVEAFETRRRGGR